jgi:hypothetical protein
LQIPIFRLANLAGLFYFPYLCKNPKMKVSKNFVIEEFVPPQIVRLYKGGERCLWFVDPRIIECGQLVRDILDSAITINNYHVGGPYKERGFRLPNTRTGASYSQHRFGRAIDLSSEKYTPLEIIEAMRANYRKFAEIGICTIENPEFTKTWVHLDCRTPLPFYPMNDFFMVNPV